MSAKEHEVDVVITYLEMEARPHYPRPSAAFPFAISLLHADDPPVWYFLALYQAVGKEYHWVDRLNDPDDVLEAFVKNPAISLFTLIKEGWPAGFFMLNQKAEGITDISYFGLVPEAYGYGLGKYLLQTAIHMGWDLEHTKKLTVNTCSLDHPSALALYQKCGFSPVQQKTIKVMLPHENPQTT